MLALRKASLHFFPPKMFARLFLLKEFKTESTKKLSNFIFQWTKTLCQNNLKNIAIFQFAFFKGYRCN